MSNHALIQNPVARSHLDKLFGMVMDTAGQIIAKSVPPKSNIRRINAYAVAICQSSWADDGIKAHVRNLLRLANARASK